MEFRPYESSKNIVDFYRRYLLSTFRTNDPDYNQQLEDIINGDEIYKGPYICLSNPYERTVTLEELVNDKVLCEEILNVPLFSKNDKLFKHQEEAIRHFAKNKNLIVTTGTGSGKTKTFMTPIIDQLLREKKKNNGELSPGVRVLIIYPMNALVNDQMEEWNNVLGDMKDITFGHLTSETKKTCTANDHPSTNYIRYRDEIFEKPPHILVTNYAMLERMLIEPQTGVLFGSNGESYWSTIVLDEAHTYKGTLGIEISALLRRLRARVNKDHLRYILTSATLGDSSYDKKIVNFANKLCSESFDIPDIIRSTTKKTICSGVALDNVTATQYEKWAKLIRNKEFEELCLDLDIGHNCKEEVISEELYNKIVNEDTIRKVINTFFSEDEIGIKTIEEATRELNISEDLLTDIITVASFSSHDGDSLFEAKYHLFIKGFEGVYITLPPVKKLFLSKRNIWEDDKKNKFIVYQVSFCNKCNALFICAQLINDGTHLVQLPPSDENYNPDIYMLGGGIDEESINEETIDKKITICAICGAIKDEAKGHLTCGHDDSFAYTLIRAKKKADHIHSCPCCGNRDNTNSITRPFVTGSEASSAVIGTSLYNELPCFREKEQITPAGTHPLCGLIPERVEIIRVPQKRQFLAFSDNRQKAAKYVDSFGNSYLDYLLKRIIFIVAEEHNNDLDDGIMFDEFASLLKDKLMYYKVFDEEINEINGRTGQIIDQNSFYLSRAHYYLVKEMIGYKAKNSLMKKGGLYFSVQLKYDNLDQKTDAKLQIMLQQFIKYGAIYDDKLNDDDYERFLENGYYNGNQRKGLKKHSDHWLPDSRKGWIVFLEKIFGNENEARYWADNMWNDWCSFTDPQDNNQDNNNYCLVSQRNDNSTDKKVLTVYKIILKRINENRPLYKCTRCGAITPWNVDNICEKSGCQGTLGVFDYDSKYKNDHYYKMYRELSPVPMEIREHTAQLSTDQAKKYQKKFTQNNGGINVLSCSTTFEMGVNVGSLQTVFMRNIPPSPANYVQRSGRAGRSKDAASFTLTFCPNSPHDQYYYKNPVKMIGGKIVPPDFNVQNIQVLYRHIFATALALFWQTHQDMYPEVATRRWDPNNIRSNHIIGDFIDKNGFEVFKQYLDNEQIDPNSVLTELLLKSFPSEVIDPRVITDYLWVDYFYFTGPEYGLAIRAEKDYKDKLQILTDKYYYFMDTTRGNNPYNAGAVQRAIDTLKEEDLIGFMSKNILLPKYGFPTDIVSLKGTDSEVELNRSLSVAITEYAPEAHVFADSKTYISRYIEKPYDYTWPLNYYRECGYCSALNRRTNRNDVPVECEQCGKPLTGEIKSYIIPKFGFRIEKQKDHGRRDYSEKNYYKLISYIGNPISPDKHKYKCNGKQIIISRSKDDTLAILNKKTFKICRKCGYATTETPLNDHKPWYAKNDENCDCNEHDERALGYELMTDVAIIDFCDNSISTPNAAWTILYSILEGLAKVLNIERTDISGCLKMIRGRFGLVIFDTAPGGAGYVKEFAEDENIIKQTFLEAYNIVKSCDCGGAIGEAACYSCLCNYQNQTHHHILKRQYAIDFFEAFGIASGLTIIPIVAPSGISSGTCIGTPVLTPSTLVTGVTPISTFDCNCPLNFEEVLDYLKGISTSEDDDRIIQQLENRKNDLLNIQDIKYDLLSEDREYRCDLFWEEANVALFLSDNIESYEALKNSGSKCFISNELEDVNELISLIRS